jgi:serine/threonine protein kinase
VTFIDSSPFLVSDHCPKGTLSDVVQNDKYRLDDNIKFSLAMDVAAGVTYLHSQHFIYGHLTSNSCYIDHRWNVKVADWEHGKLKEVSAKSSRMSRVSPGGLKLDDSNVVARQQFFTDPVLLGGGNAVKTNDVFSYAMILVEIFTREDPYAELSGVLEPVQIIEILQTSNPGMRPKIEDLKPCKVRKQSAERRRLIIFPFGI